MIDDRISVSKLAKMIDHSLLHPTLTDQEVQQGCSLAEKYNVASVCVKPYSVPQAAELLADSEVAVGTVVGFPHGNSTVRVKLYEAAQAISDGAAELDMVVNVGKVLSQDWKYVEQEIKEVVEEAHQHKALVKVIFENDFLNDPQYKVQLCRICEQVKADFVKTSTGYGFVKQEDGRYAYQGATEADVRLMRANCAPSVEVKAAGGVRDLDGLLRMRELGVTRIGASATEGIMEEARRRFGDCTKFCVNSNQ